MNNHFPLHGRTVPSDPRIVGVYRVVELRKSHNTIQCPWNIRRPYWNPRRQLVRCASRLDARSGRELSVCTIGQSRHPSVEIGVRQNLRVAQILLMCLILVEVCSDDYTKSTVADHRSIRTNNYWPLCCSQRYHNVRRQRLSLLRRANCV